MADARWFVTDTAGDSVHGPVLIHGRRSEAIGSDRASRPGAAQSPLAEVKR